MLLFGYSDRINPESSPTLSIIGLLFPIALAANFFFIILWIIIRLRLIILPLLGYVLCYFPIRTYCPLNIPQETPDDAIKVLSYNVIGFQNIAGDDTGDIPPAMEYIKDSQADIVCLQETRIYYELENNLGDIYQYIDSVSAPEYHSHLVLLSKFPILKKERIYYPSKGNLSGAFFVKIGNDTVVVINNHLESYGFSFNERDNFSKIVHGDAEKDTVKAESKRIIAKLGESVKIRAPQANTIAEYVKQHNDKSIILCGDFNDNPISYTHYKIAKELTDCYVKSGNGPGWSYNQSSMKVRIDNILCSDDWVPYNCKVDNKIGASDHYPIYCWLKLRNNQ